MCNVQISPWMTGEGTYEILALFLTQKYLAINWEMCTKCVSLKNPFLECSIRKSAGNVFRGNVSVSAADT